MNSVNLIIRIDGSSVNEGIDLFEFAPSLLSLGTVLKESAHRLDYKKEIGINIKPIERGSFLIELGLFAQSNLNEILSLIQNNDVKDIKELLEWIGLISGGTATTAYPLIKVIRWLDKEPLQKREALEGGKIKYTNHAGQQIVIEEKVDRLYLNPVIHQNLYPAFKSLEKEGVDTFASYIKGDNDSKVLLEREDISYIRSYSQSELPDTVVEGDESVYETSLNFKRGSYEGESNQWSFRKGDQIIVAVIRDEKFLARIKTGEVRPYTKDFLKVRMREVPHLVGTEIKSVTYEILEVNDYKKFEEPAGLF